MKRKSLFDKESIKKNSSELLNKFHKAVDATATNLEELKEQIKSLLDDDDDDNNKRQITEGDFVISPVELYIPGIGIIKTNHVFEFKSDYAQFIKAPLRVPTPQELINHGRKEENLITTHLVNYIPILTSSDANTLKEVTDILEKRRIGISKN